MRYATLLDGSPVVPAAVIVHTSELQQWLGKTFPTETLPDGSVRSVDHNRTNRPLQAPTCTELGVPLGTHGYMQDLPPTPCKEIDRYRDLGFGKDTLADALTVAMLCEMERAGYW